MTERYARPEARLAGGDAMVVARGLAPRLRSGGSVVHALRGVDLDVARGELLAVRGRSGSGKTTLLNLLGGLDEPTAGTRRRRRDADLGHGRGGSASSAGARSGSSSSRSG